MPESLSRAETASFTTDESALIADAIGFFRGWLHGVGLTSPGCAAVGPALAAELARIESLAVIWDAAASSPDPIVEIGSFDRRRVTAALEVFREEIDSLALFACSDEWLGERDSSDPHAAAPVIDRIDGLLVRVRDD